MNPRVLILTDALDIAGGVERFVCELANRLVEDGMEVAVGTVATARGEVRYPLAAQVRVLTGADALPPPRGWRAWRLLRQQWRVGRALATLTRRESPDVIVLNGLTTACSTLLFDRGHAVRTICCDHNHFDARSRPWRRLRAWLYPQVGAVVSLTEADAPRFRALNPRTRVIHNSSALRADAPPPLAAPMVLAVGRHVAQKGFDRLLEAWPAVVRAVPAARLRVVGDGPLREAMQRMAHIEQHYREAAVFVLPSRYEGMPLALLEAQALGLPAVAFDCPTGPADIVSDDTGILVPCGALDALASALVRVLGDAALRQRMGRAAIERSRRMFSPEAQWQRWSQLVREVAVG